MEKISVVGKSYLVPKNQGAQFSVPLGDRRAPFPKSLYRNLIVLVFVYALSIYGCGYVTRSETLKHIDSVTISPITNESKEYGLEQELGDAIKQEFFRRPSIRSEGSDSLFTATIRNYEVLPLTLGQSNQPEQYRIVLDMLFIYQDLKRNKIIRDEKNYEKTYDFYVVSGRGKPPEDLKTAKANLIREASQDIVNSIFEEW
jgi:hypothetical protein